MSVLLSVLRAEDFLLDIAHGDPPPRDENYRYMAIRALGRIGPPAKIAVPDLQALLHHIDGDLRASAARALKQIGVHN